MVRTLGLLLAVLLVPLAAQADSFVEAYGGIAQPLGEDDYDDLADTSLKLGVRAGSGAIDGSFDFTPVSTDLDIIAGDFDVQRYRLQLGGRIVKPINPKTQVFGRLSVGADIVRASISGQLLGVRFDRSETDIGLAAEFSGGVLFDLGKVRIGAQVGLPLALHFESDDPNDPDDLNLDYTGIDLDLLFLASIPL